MFRRIAAIAALSLSAGSFAQSITDPAATQVQLLAPQLVAFSGSSANFESLVNGLAQGTPVTLTTVSADGLVQIVTFLPGTTLAAVDVARSLESARQSLIARGIASPTAQQLAISLMGGTLPTALGSTPVIGVLSGNAGTTPIQVRNELAAAPPIGTGAGFSITAANLQALRTGLALGTPVTLSSTGGSVTFTPPGGAMSPFQVNQALQLASVLLAQQGILDPTPEQLRVALLGGNLATASGSVAVQGVLQGQVRNTSDSRLFGTSDSRVLGTSNTPAVNASAPAVTPPVAAPVTPVATPRGAGSASSGSGFAGAARR